MFCYFKLTFFAMKTYSPRSSYQPPASAGKSPTGSGLIHKPQLDPFQVMRGRLQNSVLDFPFGDANSTHDTTQEGLDDAESFFSLLESGGEDKKKKKKKYRPSKPKDSLLARLLYDMGSFLTSGKYYYKLGKYAKWRYERGKRLPSPEFKSVKIPVPKIKEEIKEEEPTCPPPEKIEWAGNSFIAILKHIKEWLEYCRDCQLDTVWALGDLFTEPPSGGTPITSNGNATNIAPGASLGLANAWNNPNWVGFTVGGPAGLVPDEKSFNEVRIDLSTITITPLGSPQNASMGPFFSGGGGTQTYQIQSLIQIGGPNGPVIGSNMGVAATANNLSIFLGNMPTTTANGSQQILLP